MAVDNEIVELRHTHNRYGKYVDHLDSEIITLAKMRFLQYIRDDYNNNDVDVKMTMRDCISLERFGFADHAHLYINGASKGWAWCVTEEGNKILEGRRPRSYGCKCKHAIRLRCVCTERTYCPNPEHTGNGCHGSHD